MKNYAREHWELFSVGEPSVIGGKYPLYTDSDIAEAARAFTGWTTVRTVDFEGNSVERSAFMNERHDDTEKVLWRDTPYEVRGYFKAEDITNLTLDTRPEAARFLASRLFSTFIHDNPSPALVNQLATIIKQNDWNLVPVLRVILNSEAMFSLEAHKNRVKDPITYYVGFLRRTGIKFNPIRLDRILRESGLEVTNPPDVSGWPGNKTSEAHKTTYWHAWRPQYAQYPVEIMIMLERDYRDENGLPTQSWDSFLPSPLANAPGVVDHLTKLLGIAISDSERKKVY